MIRLILLPLLLFTLSVACMGQTFQYSRGWTNGKRASNAATILTNIPHYHRSEDTYADIYDFQENERKLERCLIQLQRFVGNALLRRAALSLNANKNNNINNNNNNNNNNDNVLYPTNHHQSNELFDELNAAVGVVGVADPNDYVKH